jgi:outer membrane lipoprotein LolB
VIGDNAGMILPTMLRWPAIACAAVLLAGCATTSTVPLSNAPVGAYREQVDLDGRLFVNFEKDGKPDTISVKFNWQQQGELVDVSLVSPLGQTVAKIKVTPGAATLTQSGKAPLTARDINGLTVEALGWSLPVAGLRDWLQGYASGADGKRFVASPANNSVTTADGWRLTYVSWQEGADAASRPKRIDASRAASASSSALEIRIVLDAQG